MGSHRSKTIVLVVVLHFRSVLLKVVGLSTTHETWKALEMVYASQARSRVLQLKTRLQTTRKGSMPMDEYLTKMKMVADNLGTAGYLVSDEDLMLHVLAGLGPEYDLVVVNLTSRIVPATWQESQALLLNQESHIDQMNTIVNLCEYRGL